MKHKTMKHMKQLETGKLKTWGIESMKQPINNSTKQQETQGNPKTLTQKSNLNQQIIIRNIHDKIILQAKMITQTPSTSC